MKHQDGLRGIIQSFLQKYLDELNGQMPPQGFYDLIMKEVEKPLFEAILQITCCNQKLAAEILGMNRNTLRKKIVEFDINIPEVREKSITMKDAA